VASRKIGILGYRDVVFFDEIASTSFTDPDATISVLKDYMQTGRFSRGPLAFTAQASIVLGGNIDTDVVNKAPSPRYRHLLEPLPEELGKDTAFLDRLHAFLAGWELPKIRPENYAQGYGFITDYLAEIFTRLRRRNLQTVVNARVDLSSLTGRNQDTIRKTADGLLKLVFPHRTAEDLGENELEGRGAALVGKTAEVTTVPQGGQAGPHGIGIRAVQQASGRFPFSRCYLAMGREQPART